MIITLITNGLLLVKDSSVLLQARCCCTGGVGVCGRMWSGQYYLQCMLLCMISYSVSSCVLYMYNHSLAVDMAGVARRGLCMRVVGKDIQCRDGSQ